MGRGGWQGGQGSGHPQLSVSVEDFGLKLWEAIEGFFLMSGVKLSDL